MQNKWGGAFLLQKTGIFAEPRPGTDEAGIRKQEKEVTQSLILGSLDLELAKNHESPGLAGGSHA